MIGEKLFVMNNAFVSVQIPFRDTRMNLYGNYCMIVRVDY